jgi:anthranilate synthase/aminodeoxychorismate synthase-like glutamine amidotransferase
MIVVIDNYDSFTYNLVQYLGELGAELAIFRNDQVTLEQIAALRPGQIVNDVIRSFGPTTPILGVCLGHQCIGQVYGGKVSRAPRLMHGKTSSIYHHGEGIFSGVPSPFTATRYHSLIVEEPLPDCLRVTAFTREGEIMGIQHKRYPVAGVQFHPESILTEHGKRILQNFLRQRDQEIGRL